MSGPCVFCLENGHLDERQIVLRGASLYVCAPRGQLVDGSLIIAPYECVGCFAYAPTSQLAELIVLQAVIARFYADVLGVSRATFYEQGRAGGGAVTDPLGGFPYHAHLCCLPAAVDLHPLVREHDAVPVEGLSDIAAASAERPYAYVEAAGRRAVYRARSPEGWAALERLRLKPWIAELLGRPDTRAFPSDEALDLVAHHLPRATV